MKVAALLLAGCLSLPAAQFTNSTSATIQGSLTNGLSAGDTLWIAAGTYTPINTNPSSLGATQWAVGVSGADANLITIRALPGQAAKFDQQWRFNTSHHLRFRDLEFFDSAKGHNPTNGSFPVGPWLHFDGALANSSNEWINCYLHDTANLWSGGTAGESVRGCLIQYAGMVSVEHVAYSTGKRFVGNINAWSSGSFVQLGVTNFAANSNILFGCGIINNEANKEILAVVSGSVTGNCFYETISEAYHFNGGGTGFYSANKVASPFPVVASGSSPFTALGSTIYMNDSGNAFPLINRQSSSAGSWVVNSNLYFSATASLVFENNNVTRTFAQWKSDFPAFDANSTATAATAPSDSVTVYANADDAKRANIAIYNWSQANNVTVDLISVLASGDTYALYSAQNYGTPIQTGTYNGSSISVPMTNLGVASILYGGNWGLATPAATSPKFAAFVVFGYSASNLVSKSITGNAVMSGRIGL